MMRTNKLLNVLRNYIETYLPDTKGLSNNTIKSYKATFRLLFEFFKVVYKLEPDQISFSSLDYDHLNAFLLWLESNRNDSASTRNQRLSALSSFSKYAQSRNFDAAVIFRNAVLSLPVKKAPVKMRQVMTREEVKIFLSLPDVNKPTERRNKVLLSFMYSTAARAQEVCDLTTTDISIRNGKYYVTLHGKGRKARIVPINKKMYKLLLQHIKTKPRQYRNSKYVFNSQTNEQMSVSAIEEIFKKYQKMAKDKYSDMFNGNYTPHTMRHTAAAHMLESGVSIPVIRSILGHSSIETTMIYARVNQAMVDKKVKEWNEEHFAIEPEANPKEIKDDLDFLK